MDEDDSKPAVSCSLEGADVGARADQVRDLFDSYRETRPRADGLTLAFDGVEAALPAVAAFVERERVCCAFADYRIEVSPPYEETRLTVTGPEGTVDLFERGLVAVLESDELPGEWRAGPSDSVRETPPVHRDRAGDAAERDSRQ